MQKIERILTAVIIIAFLVSACTEANVPKSRASEADAVYAALLNDELERPFGLVLEDSILIINRIYNITFYEIAKDDFLFEHAIALDQDTLEDFRTVNQDARLLIYLYQSASPMSILAWNN